MKQKPKIEFVNKEILKLRNRIRSNEIVATQEELKTYLNILKENKHLSKYSDTLLFLTIYLLYKDTVIKDGKKIKYDHIFYFFNKISLLEAREMLADEMHLSKYFDLYYCTSEKISKGSSFKSKEPSFKEAMKEKMNELNNISYTNTNIHNTNYNIGIDSTSFNVSFSTDVPVNENEEENLDNPDEF